MTPQTLPRVICTIKFFYDPESYISDLDEEMPSDEEIARRCREYMLEDVRNEEDPFPLDNIEVSFDRG